MKTVHRSYCWIVFEILSGQKLNNLNLGLGFKASQGWEAFIFTTNNS
jgi:hypothetical protein